MKKYSLLSFVICPIIAILSCEKNFDTLKIISGSPVNHATGVLPGFYAEVEFNNDVNRADIENSFRISGSGDVPGSFQWIAGNKFRYLPSNPVTKTGRYVMEIPRSVRDVDGNIMDTDFISEFYIGTDFVPPEVLSSDPPFTTGAADNIPVTRNITVNFSKSMNRESVEKAFGITPDVPGYFVWSQNVTGMDYSRMTYTLTGSMSYGKLYTFTVSKTGADISGNSLSSDYTVNFITGNDFTPPRVSGIYDASAVPGYWLTGILNDGVTRGVEIAADFSEPMERTSVESAFSVTPSVQGNFKWVSDQKFIFTPSSMLDPERNYQVFIDKTAKDINGLKLDSVYSVEIKTSASDSLYLKCGNIWGSADNSFTGPPLSEGIPAQSDWPLIIVMNPAPVITTDASGATVTTYSQDYYIKIQFVSSVSPYIPVDVNKYSVIDNTRIETFRSGPAGLAINSAGIVKVIWNDNGTVTLKFNPLTNKLIPNSPALYRLTIAGGANGVKDINGNPAKNDIVIEFREAL